MTARPDADLRTRTFLLDAAASTVEVEGRSSLHPLRATCAPGSLTGWLRAAWSEEGVVPGDDPGAHLQFPITALSFGNSLYDKELPKAVHAERHPDVRLDLLEASSDAPETWTLRLRIDLHGTQRTVEETAEVTALPDGGVRLRGRHRLDVTDYGLHPPSRLGMRVHSDFRIGLDLTGRPEGG